MIADAYHDLLHAPNTALLASILPDDTPQASPVWFWFDGERIKISTTAERQKHRNVQRNPNVALTIVDPDDSSFGAALIPETLARTNLGQSAVGENVNLEFDMMAKYARNLLTPYVREKRQS